MVALDNKPRAREGSRGAGTEEVEEVSVVNDPAPAWRAPPGRRAGGNPKQSSGSPWVEESKPRIPGDLGDQSWPCGEERATKSVRTPAACDRSAGVPRTLPRERPAAHAHGSDSHLQSTRLGRPRCPRCPRCPRGSRTASGRLAPCRLRRAAPQRAQSSLGLKKGVLVPPYKVWREASERLKC